MYIISLISTINNNELLLSKLFLNVYSLPLFYMLLILMCAQKQFKTIIQ